MIRVIAKRDRSGENFSRKTLSHLYYKLLIAFVEEVQFDDGVGDFRLFKPKELLSPLHHLKNIIDFQRVI